MISESIKIFKFIIKSLVSFPDSPPGILSIMAYKAIDALSEVGDNNLGIAESDIWEGSYNGAMALYIYLYGPANTGLLNNAMQLAHSKKFKDACSLLIPKIEEHHKMRIGETT